MVDIGKLKQEQLKLAEKVIITDSFKKIETVGGCDLAYIDNTKVVSAIVVLDYKTLKVIEKKYAIIDTPIPYIPSFLSYRDAPAIVEAFNKLDHKPDILLCDCNGILHPRRIGCASHVGILLDQVTIGVAKNLLCGELKEDTVIVDKEVRAVTIKTKDFAKPIFISPGHKISLKTSVEIVKKCLKGHKLPEPLHQAHKYATKLKRELR
jgi:deoxyribonuclease V